MSTEAPLSDRVIPEDGVLASAPQVQARTLFDFSEAITRIMDEMADAVPDDGAEEDEANRMRREALELQLHDLLSRESDKVDRTADVLRTFEREATACHTEAERLRRRSKTFEGKRERLAGYVLDVMRIWEVKKLAGTKSTLTRIQNVDTVEVDDPALLPFGMQRWTFTFTPATPEQLAELQEFVASRWPGQASVAADKVAVKKALTSAEAKTAGALESGANAATLEPIPEGVRLKPGTWRLAIR